MSGDIFDHRCPLVIDQDDGSLPLAEDRKIDFRLDGSMVFKPIPPAGACESAGAVAKVDEESDPYQRLLATIRGCEGAVIVPPPTLIGRIFTMMGLRRPKTECPAALQHFDYSSRRQLTDYFGRRAQCR